MSGQAWSTKSNRCVIAVALSSLLGASAMMSAQAAQPKPTDSRVLWLDESSPAAFDGFIVYYRDDTNALDDTSTHARAVRVALDRDVARATQGRSFTIKPERRVSTGGHVLKRSGTMTLQQANAFMAAMAENPQVTSIEANLRMYPLALPNDPLLSYQWSLWNPTGGINVEPAWDTGASGNGVVIAVIDTGITSHPELNAKVIAGYDMISDPSSARDGTGRDNNPADEGDWTINEQCGPNAPSRNSTWHGTHVAGTAAAITNNGVGIAGVAYNAWVQPVRVLGACGGTLADIADGITWASGGAVPSVPTNPTPARVLNLSLGGQSACGATYQNAINGARSRNSVLIVAAGNDSIPASMATPANCSGVVTIAANGPSGSRASYSNYGPVISVTAPGGDSGGNPNYGILSTVNAGQTTPGAADYGMKDGTSMAAPHVAGVAALMIQKNSSLTPDQVAAILRNTARPFPTYCSGGCGTGIVDAGAAVAAASGTAISAYPLSVLPVGGGTGKVTSAPAGINCGSSGTSCSLRFTANSSVTLTATADPGFAFAGWVGSCSGTSPTCTLPMNQGHAVYAVFDYPILPLNNGVLISGLSGMSEAARYFQISLPASVTELKVEMWGGSGDADLYVRRGQFPTTDAYDCRPYLYGNTETCTFPNPAAGNWLVMVKGAPDFADVILRAKWTVLPPDPRGVFCDGLEAYPTPCR